MGKTYSCDLDGCAMVFSRDYELKKHKVKHEDSDKLFHCEWPKCNFYTLDSRNLDVHLAMHTGKKIHDCPDSDTIEVLGESGWLKHEKRCEYRTNDPSLLTKHRKRAHKYIPHPRAPSKNTGTIEFVFDPLSCAATSHTTPRGSNSKRARKPKAAVQLAKSTRTRATGKAPDVPLPSTSQQGADEHKRANVELPDVPDHSSAIFTDIPNENMALNAHGQLSVGPDTDSTTPVVPNQGVVLPGPTPNFSWPTPYAEGYTSPSTIGAYNTALYNPAQYNRSPNSQMNTSAMGGFGVYFGQGNSPGFEGWDESDWNNLWEK